MEDELADLEKWLGITGQQFDVLKGIHKLRLEGQRANPKSISVAYHRDYGKGIQVSNLFHVIDALIDKGLVRKEGPASYGLDLSGITRSLEDYEQHLAEEVKDFKAVKNETIAYLERVVKRKEPIVQYMGLTQFFDKAAESVSRARTYYLVAHFPKLFHPTVLRKKLNQYAYLELIEDRCLIKQDLEVNIITDFDIDFLCKDFTDFSVPKKEMLKTALLIVDQIQYAIDHHSNLRIYYAKKLIGMDMLLPIRDEPRDLYLYMRDQDGGIIGGVYIESPEAAKRAYSTFSRFPGNYVLLKGAQGKKILNKLRKEMRARFC